MSMHYAEPYQIDTGGLGDTPLPELTYSRSGLEILARDAFSPGHVVNNPEDGGRTLMQRLARAGITRGHQFEALLQDALERAKSLRHAPVVKASNAVRWIAGIASNEPGRLLWHIDRLDGVPASSAWTYVAEAEGKRSFFNTARDLDFARLMMNLPIRSNWNMFRGNELEPLNNRVFYALHGKKFAPDPESLDLVRRQRGIPGHPWLIGNPDEISTYLTNPSRPRVLVDYKCPAQPKTQEDSPALEYRVQLHNYAMIASGAGRPVSAIALSHLYVAEDLAKLWASMLEEDPSKLDQIFDHAMFAIRKGHDTVVHTVQQVHIDPSLQARVIAACKAADDRILAGQISPRRQQPKPEVTPETLAHAQVIEGPLARVLTLKSELDRREKAYKEQLGELYEGIDTSKGSGLSIIGLSRWGVLDTGAALDALRARGINTAGLVRYETKQSEIFNKERIVHALSDADIDVDQFLSETGKIGLTAARQGPKFEAVQRLKLQAERQVDLLMGDIAPPMDHSAPVAPSNKPRRKSAPADAETMRG